jgi:hypothetical protein
MNTPVHLPGLPDGIDHGGVVAEMIRRAGSAGFDAWWQRVEAVGFCANPIQLAGRDELGREHQVFTRCNNRRAAVCPSCSDLYSRDTGSSSTPGCKVDTTTSPPPWPITPRCSSP